MHIDSNGWLQTEAGGPAVFHVPTKRTTKLERGSPDAVVLHWSADAVDEGGYGDSLALAKSIVEPPAPGEHAASWNFLLDRSGAIVQSAPVNIGTWHVGKPGTIEGRHYENINHGTLGIEIENAGRLTKIGNDWFGWPFYKAGHIDGKLVRDARFGPDPRFLIAKGRIVTYPDTTFQNVKWRAGSFDGYTTAQEVALQGLIAALAKHFSWGPSHFRYGHAMFVPPSYKEDPGPGMLGAGGMLEGILARLFPTDTPRAA